MSLVNISHAQSRVPVTVFQLQDRISLGNFAEFEETVKQAYNEGVRDAIIDLSRTTSLTSIGIRALVIVHKMLSPDHGHHLKVVSPASLRELLEIAGVTEYIEIYDTLGEAVASF